MEYDKKNKKIVQQSLKIIRDNKDDHRSFDVEDKSVIREIYEDIEDANIKIKKLIKDKKVRRSERLNIVGSIKEGIISARILNYIREKRCKKIEYECKLDERNIRIHFYVYDKISKAYLERGLKNILMWLSICGKYSKNHCSRTLKVSIYLTPLVKDYPMNDEILGPDNINTGYSYVCSENNEIVVYRKEEWFKVFIHECFHAYDLQPSNSVSHEIGMKLNNEFSLSSGISIIETYVEVWARIINSYFSAINNSSNYDEFLSLLSFNFRLESIFSFIQAIKVLNYVGLTYTDILKNKDKVIENYKEDTNVFAYIILGAILMNKPMNFIIWCNNNNINLFKFNNTRDKTILFWRFILSHMKAYQTKTKFKKYEKYTSMVEGIGLSVVNSE